LDAASEVLGVSDLDEYFLKLRNSIGPQWGKDHKVAMAAAIVGVSSSGPSSAGPPSARPTSSRKHKVSPLRA
jgi:hypothetical protein